MPAASSPTPAAASNSSATRDATPTTGSPSTARRRPWRSPRSESSPSGASAVSKPAADRAVEQPGPHIRQAIGERPQQAGEQRQRWDQLARDLEQHRLRYEIDVERDGITGPRDAPERQHGAYQRQRDELSRRVRQLQAERGLEAARETDAPDAGLDL